LIGVIMFAVSLLALAGVASVDNNHWTAQQLHAPPAVTKRTAAPAFVQNAVNLKRQTIVTTVPKTAAPICGNLTTGDLLRDHNASSGSGTVPEGAIAQLRCVSTADLPALVCIPGWTGGHDGNVEYCEDEPLPSCGSTSNWWVTCSQVERVDDQICGGKFRVGDAVYSTTSGPSAAVDLPKGKIGQVYCLAGGSPPVGVNWGADYSHGHDGNVGVCTESALPRSGKASAWFVDCDELSALANVTSMPPGPAPPGPTPTPPAPPAPTSDCQSVLDQPSCDKLAKCSWCVSSDKTHSLCFYADHKPDPASWSCA